jgi:NADPH:quinone reductase-like Zn-dependent oxidoreductase
VHKFALAAGATVIATTSSDAKASKLKELGAHHVVNYRENTQWGLAAKKITPGSRGVDVVVDVGGNATLGESLNAVRIDGVVVLAGLLGGNETVEPLMKVLSTICIVRGVVLGTKKMMKDMIQFVEKNNIKMALDDQIFSLEDTQEAIQRLQRQHHFAKVVIRIAAES